MDVASATLKGKSSPFCASFMLITLLFVYMSSFECMELFISFIL